MEVLFLCFFSHAAPRDRSAPALALFARLPRAGVFDLLVRGNALHADLLLRGVRSPPGRTCSSCAMGLVIAVDWVSRDWSMPSIRFRAIGHRDRSGSVDLARRQAYSMI